MASSRESRQRSGPEDRPAKKLDIDDDEPSSVGFGTTTVTKVDPDGKGTIARDH